MGDGVTERKGKSGPRDVSAATRTVGVVTSGSPEFVGVFCSEGVSKEELDARAEEAAASNG